MSSLLTTYSKFYFGYVINNDNYILNFDEGGPELVANLNPSEYTLTDFATEIERALNDVGALAYTVSVNRSTRQLTIAASGIFSLLASTGSGVGTSPFSLMGFSATDLTGSTTYTGTNASGSSYSPQFKMQSYIPSTLWQEAADSSVNKTSSGIVEVIKFGTIKFLQMQFKYINEFVQECHSPIREDLSALSNIETFLQYLTTRAPLEFMADENTPNTFETVILESSSSYRDGTGYKLNELYSQDLPGYFETEVLKFRVREQ